MCKGWHNLLPQSVCHTVFLVLPVTHTITPQLDPLKTAVVLRLYVPDSCICTPVSAKVHYSDSGSVLPQLNTTRRQSGPWMRKTIPGRENIIRYSGHTDINNFESPMQLEVLAASLVGNRGHTTLSFSINMLWAEKSYQLHKLNAGYRCHSLHFNINIEHPFIMLSLLCQ